jgi:hypothetical protein
MKNGEGTYYYSTGNRYIGDWVDDYKTGQGVFVWSDGSQYQMSRSKEIVHHWL